MKTLDHPTRRNFIGYAGQPPAIDWGAGARVAIAVIVNYEEGAEYSMLDGDGFSEATLTDAGQSIAAKGTRDLAAESMFEFGARVGVWRLMQIFDAASVPVTVSAAALALERNPAFAAYLKTSAHAVQSHGYRWINHLGLDEESERAEITKAVASFAETLGKVPKGWMCRYGPSLNTRALLQAHSSFSYDSDSYADEVPYWDEGPSGPHLIIPHSFANNDNKFAKGWFSGPDDWLSWHLAALDQLILEDAPCALLTVSLHCRVSGQAARASGVARFLDYARSKAGVKCLTRDQIHALWREQNPPPG